jgi:hypothetical protein
MTQYLVAIHHPDDDDPAVAEDDAMSLRAQPDGQVLIAGGPDLPTSEHVGGFRVRDVADLDAALASGRMAAIAWRAPVDVRQFH